MTICSTTTRMGNRAHSVTTGAPELAQRVYEQALDIDIEPTISIVPDGHCIEFIATDADRDDAIAKATTHTI